MVAVVVSLAGARAGARMRREALLLALAVGSGFILGFLWGQGTRNGLSEATDVSFSGGVVTTRTDVKKALGAGLDAALGALL